MEKFVALLRAVNVGGRKLPMAELREVCGGLGWTGVATYIQSGNAVFEAAAKQAELERKLEAALGARFGFEVPVIVRSASQWAGYSGANPFPDAAEKEPNRLMLMVSKQPPAAGAAAALQDRARDGERVAAAGDAIWIHYPSGAGTSRLSPSLIDRLIGSPATARNFRTVLKLEEMLAC
jgi:uncharacterized protein (DUF1697 family)